MATVPGVTLTGTINAIDGSPNAGRIACSLVNFGSNPPLVAGTAVIAPLTTSAQAGSDGTFSVALWGNYQLSPAGTCYQVDVYGADGSQITVALYKFDNAGTFDLSNLSPTVVVPSRAAAALSPVATSGDYNDLRNKPTLPKTTVFASGQWLTSYDAVTGTFAQSQPSWNDISDRPVLPNTRSVVATKFLTGYDATTGMFTNATPTWTDISSKPTFATVATSGSYTDLSNKPTLPAAKTAVAGQPLLSYDASTGTFTQGTLTAAQVGALASTTVLPANTTATANQFFTAYNSGTGAFTKAQPSFSNLSGSATAAQLPTFGSAAAGIVPASGGGTSNFLRADGTWAAPSGGGGGASLGTANTWTAAQTFQGNGSLVNTLTTNNAAGGTNLSVYTNASAAGFNPIVQAGDVLFQIGAGGAKDSGALTIAPWSDSSKGLRVDGATGNVTVGAINLSNDANGGLELGPLTGTSKAPFIDFHYHGATNAQDNQDYNVRLQNDADQQLTCSGNFKATASVNAASYKVNGSNLAFSNLSGTASTSQLPARTAAISYIIDGGGSVPTTGVKGQITVPTACTITGWYITADVAGSATVNINTGSYASFPTLTTQFSPSLSSVQKNSATGLSYALNAGDQVQFNLSSVTTCTRLNITLVISAAYA